MNTRQPPFRFVRTQAVAIAGCAAMAGLVALSAVVAGQPDSVAPRRMVTRGPARVVVENLYRCPVTVTNHRVSAVGQITASNGTVVTVPTVTALQRGLGPNGADLYNECTQVTPRNTAEAAATDVPVVDVDRDGDVIDGYIVADNYYELYVNGTLVSVDATPYTPFNSARVRFRVTRPYTLAFLLVDWDEHLGLGMEMLGGNPWHPGDGGLIARFSDGTITDGSWKAQSFYIAPLNSPDDVVEKGNVHDTTALGRVHPVAKKPDCRDQCFAVHYPIPGDWASPRFSDSPWPRAEEYTDTDIGVTGLPGYTRYPELFKGARWIWTANLVFDNVVIARKTVR